MDSARLLRITNDQGSWLHQQFVHFDANFRLTLEKRTNRDESSSSLWRGNGYFVDAQSYERYLSEADMPRREVSSLWP